MSLRDQIIHDVPNVFFNPLEFSELHVLVAGGNPRRLNMIVETFTLDGRPIQTAEGVSAHNAIIHIDPRVLGFTPAREQVITLDNLKYRITAVSNDMGVLKISLSSNGGGR
ncbi:hypothetical protein MKY98_07805 [Paenibacillus sp. FSL M8-0228]|uniref:hypothetical protein n=1 Tax=Paenibacillus sp. FSL M8-0228 TaxID=2921620 RepID=UPI0030F9CB9F